MGQLLTMSHNELDRVEIIKKLIEQRLYESEAALSLQLSVRQIRRLKAAYLKYGVEGLISKKRKVSSNRKYSDAVKETALAIIREFYIDFRPTFAAEKLAENHDILVSRETIRKWMIEAGIWKTRIERQKCAYQPRYRRDCQGFY